MISTAQIVFERAVEAPCGESCVAWAIGMLEKGADGDYLCRLAGMQPPFNHFELSYLRDRAFEEQAVPFCTVEQAIFIYSRDIASRVMSSELDEIEAISLWRQLYYASDCDRALLNLQLLWWAYEDLQSDDVQWYWDGATRDNIRGTVREQAGAFLEGIDEAK